MIMNARKDKLRTQDRHLNPIVPLDFVLIRVSNSKLTETDRFRPKSPGGYYTNKLTYSPRISVAQVSNLLYRGLPVRRSMPSPTWQKIAFSRSRLLALNSTQLNSTLNLKLNHGPCAVPPPLGRMRDRLALKQRLRVNI